MKAKGQGQQSLERLLDTAERLFSRKGFAATKLRDIADELGLTHASFYYHFPGGKAALFAAVTERNIRRHGEGLAASMEAGGPPLKGKLRGAAAWLLSRPAMDLIRMAETDMPALPEDTARMLMNLVYDQMIRRLGLVIRDAADSGSILRTTDSGLIAGALIGFVESLHAIPDFAVRRSRMEMAEELLDVILRGLDYREGET